MIRASKKTLVGFVALLVLGGYSAYRWQSAAPPSELHNQVSVASEPDKVLINPSKRVATTTEFPVNPKSQFQLHAAFREAQRCFEEQSVIRMNAAGNEIPVPAHISGCDDLKGAQRLVFESTKAAAAAGDLDAQMCYLTQEAADRNSEFALSEAEKAEYQALAPKYVDAAFRRGDWRVVNLLGYQVVDSFGMFIFLEQWSNPAREYRAHQLLLLGAGEVDPQNSESWLADLHMPNYLGSNLSPQEIQDSNVWVQETYDKYFISQPKLLSGPRVCTAADGE